MFQQDECMVVLMCKHLRQNRKQSYLPCKHERSARNDCIMLQPSDKETGLRMTVATCIIHDASVPVLPLVGYGRLADLVYRGKISRDLSFKRDLSSCQ